MLLLLYGDIVKSLKGIYARFPLAGFDSIFKFSLTWSPFSYSMTLDAYHIDSVNTCVTTRQQWNASWQSKRRRSGTNSEHSHCDCQLGQLVMITFTNGNETGRDSSRRASLPCARVKTVIHSKLNIRFSDAHLNTATIDGFRGWSFCLNSTK